MNYISSKIYCSWVVCCIFLLLVSCAGQPAPVSPTITNIIQTSPSVTQDVATLSSTPVFPTSTIQIASTLDIVPSPTSPPLVTLPYPPFGIQGSGENNISLIQQAGAHWIRLDGPVWYEIEPIEGRRNWAARPNMEAGMKTASALGLQPILVFRGTPTWAQDVPGSFCGPIKTEKLAAFASFMAEAVARYSAPPYNIKYWELGNEPDVDPALVPAKSAFGCWGKSNDDYYGGGQYAEMLKVVYPAIKSVDPDAQVLIGGLLLDCNPINPPEVEPGKYKDCSSSRFFEGILENNGGDYFDGVSFHAYDAYMGKGGVYNNPNWHSSWNTTGPVFINKARYLRSLLAMYGYPRKYLLNTEYAVLCGRTGLEEPCQTEDFEFTKANYVVQSMVMAFAEQVYANIWYRIDGWRGSSLVNKLGQHYPAYQAFMFVSDKLREASLKSVINSYNDVRGYEFVHNGKRTWVLWSMQEEATTITLPEKPIAVYDVLGLPITVNTELAVTVSPIYIDWIDP